MHLFFCFQPNEKELPSGTSGPPKAEVPDQEIVNQLLMMGMTENACKRAALAVKNANAEMAANWLFQHMSDPDINDPLPEPEKPSGGGGQSNEPKEESIQMLMNFGIMVRDYAVVALKNTSKLKKFSKTVRGIFKMTTFLSGTFLWHSLFHFEKI